MKKLSTLILLSFFATAASAQIFPDKKLHVSVVPIFSYSVGQLGEEIYYSANPSKRISELEWERNIFLFGANADIKYRQFKWSIGAASSLFEQKSGDMRDSDWLNESDYSMKTTYSVGTNNAVANYELTTSFSYDFDATSFVSFSPIIAVMYDYDSFERRDAEGWYSSDRKHWWYDDSSTHYPYTYWNDEKGRYVTRRLAGIDIFRHSLFTWLGFSTKIKPFSKVNFDFEILLSPFSYFYAIDTHHAKNTNGEWWEKHYKMKQLSYFNFLSLSPRVNFIINSIFELSLETSYTFNFESARGSLFLDFWENDPQDEFYKSGQDSGMSLENFTVTLGIKIKIF